jgi:tetratricopeptide (TPR) repeat protein
MPQTEENKREQIDVRLSMWAPMWASGYPEGSLQILKDGEMISEAIGDERSLAIFCSWLGNYYAERGDPLQGIKYLEKCFQEAEKTEDVDLITPVAVTLSISYLISGAHLKEFDMAPKIIKLLEETHRESEFFGRPFNAYVELIGINVNSLAWLGKFNEGEVFCEKGLRFAHSIKHLPSLGHIELFYGILFATKGDGRRAVKHSKDSLKYFEEAEGIPLLHLVFLVLGWGHYLLGELETARNHLQKGLEIQKDMGIVIWMSWLLCGLSMVHLDLGEFESAQSCAEKALNSAQENKEKFIEGYSWTILGRVLGKKEPTQMDEAEEYILKGIKILEELKTQPYVSTGYLWLGELNADMGQREKALENLKKAEVMFKEMGMDYWLDKTRETMDRL